MLRPVVLAGPLPQSCFPKPNIRRTSRGLLQLVLQKESSSEGWRFARVKELSGFLGLKGAWLVKHVVERQSLMEITGNQSSLWPASILKIASQASLLHMLLQFFLVGQD